MSRVALQRSIALCLRELQPQPIPVVSAESNYAEIVERHMSTWWRVYVTMCMKR